MISGGNFTGEVTRLGTPGNDTLNGMDVGSRFVSGLGNDGLKGGGGGLLTWRRGRRYAPGLDARFLPF